MSKVVLLKIYCSEARNFQEKFFHATITYQAQKLSIYHEALSIINHQKSSRESLLNDRIHQMSTSCCLLKLLLKIISLTESIKYISRRSLIYPQAHAMLVCINLHYKFITQALASFWRSL